MAAAIAQRAQKEGMAIPAKLRNAPTLFDGLDFYYDAYLELMTDRDNMTATSPIPWTAIDQYARRYHLEGEAYEDFLEMIRGADDGTRAWRRSKSKSGKTGKGGVTPPTDADPPPRQTKRRVGVKDGG